MISFNEAMDLIALHPLSLTVQEIEVASALGYSLATDIFAPMNLPPFDNSAVDGFAVRYIDLKETRLPIAHTVWAEKQAHMCLQAGSCAAIMTGAPLPLGSDTVVMKEHARVLNGAMISTESHVFGQHIRKAGSDIKQHSLVAKKGTRLTPALIGVLLGLGMARVKVFMPPKIAIISTGDELVDPPKPLQYGQVYSFIGAMLKALCQGLGINEVQVERVGDNQDAIEKAIRRALSADLVLITGGMSQGEHDFVRPALARIGVEQVFWQGAWRPGKPLYFGLKDGTHIIGLPGNPVASFVGFRIFVQNLLAHSSGADCGIKWGQLSHGYQKKIGWTLFLRATVDEKNSLTLLPHQESHQIFSLAQSNALVLIEAQTTIVKAGKSVQYYGL